MEKDILSEVIDVEREIQKCLDLEKIKSREWLEKVKKESEEELVLEEKKIREALNKAVENAQHEAESKAAAVVKKAAEEAERLKHLKNNTLLEIVERHINRILPG